MRIDMRSRTLPEARRADLRQTVLFRLASLGLRLERAQEHHKVLLFLRC
jgi:hypothetical protein